MRRRSFLALAAARPHRIAIFEADVTPPPGTALCFSLVPPGERVGDPLRARGVVLYPADSRPVVLCALDWLGIGNTSQQLWRRALARAVNTDPDRVAVHTVHQHDAPGDDQSAADLLGIDNLISSRGFVQTARARVAAAAKAATPRQLTHVSAGRAEVERIASNRRIVSPEGKFLFQRFTACRNSTFCAAPEGLIDPGLTSVSFWSGEERVASLQYYATHPMSHYGKGDISADFPGIARDDQPVFTLYFTGAAGNIGAGKYNDGAPENRRLLAERLSDAMRRARAAETRHPVSRLEWSVAPALLPHREGPEFTESSMEKAMRDASSEARVRVSAARYLAWYRLSKQKVAIPVSCLHLGAASLLHLPAESFVEYQIAAQRERPGILVATAAYGDYGPMYIPTARAHAEGGYETSAVSRVAPSAEEVLLAAQRRALKFSV
jgi:hypothetical protein